MTDTEATQKTTDISPSERPNTNTARKIEKKMLEINAAKKII